jgi:hypothetical protein
MAERLASLSVRTVRLTVGDVVETHAGDALIADNDALGRRHSSGPQSPRPTSSQLEHRCPR